jgi:hypothetical protein
MQLYADFRKSPAAVVVVERSPLSSLCVFASSLHQCGVLIDDDYNELLELFGLVGWFPNALVQVDMPVHTCLSRIHAREAAATESSIDLGYLGNLQYWYDYLLEDIVMVPQLRVFRDVRPMHESMTSLLLIVDNMVALALPSTCCMRGGLLYSCYAVLRGASV